MYNKKLNIYEFETDGKNKYIFDNATGLVIPNSNSIKYIIENYSLGEELIIKYLTEKLDRSESTAKIEYNYIRNLINIGYFYKQSSPTSFSAEDCKNLMLRSSGSQLILILTEECNLRCKYCVYSDHYSEHKTYSNKRMTFKIAKQAIDTYMMWYHKKKIHGFRETPRISFYGGEPFLEYKLIEQIIDYCKEKDYQAQFLATTNGTVFNDTIIEMVVNNNFHLSFSLDGNKLNNDRNRVFKHGGGTFDIILKNVKSLQNIRNSRQISQPLSFVCCYDSYSDMNAILSFFRESRKYLGEFQLIFNEVYKYDTTYYDYCNKRYEDGDLTVDNKTFSRSVNKLRNKFLNEAKEGIDSSPLTSLLFQALYYYKYKAQGFESPLGNACVPGDKLAVDPEGNFFICEKATQQYKIGDINSGISWNEVAALTNKFLILRAEYCGNCKISRLCDACYVHFMRNDNLEFNDLFCADKKKQIETTLSILYSTLEINPNAFFLDGEQNFENSNC